MKIHELVHILNEYPQDMNVVLMNEGREWTPDRTLDFHEGVDDYTKEDTLYIGEMY